MKTTPYAIAVICRFASEGKAMKLRLKIISEAGPDFKAPAGVETGGFRDRIEKSPALAFGFAFVTTSDVLARQVKA
jgi:hypothetical protein